MSGWALFQIATTLSMLGTQVQKVSVTFWPEDAGADADAADDDVPAAGWVDELPDEEQPAAASRGERRAGDRDGASAPPGGDELHGSLRGERSQVMIRLDLAVRRGCGGRCRCL